MWILRRGEALQPVASPWMSRVFYVSWLMASLVRQLVGPPARHSEGCLVG